MGYSRNTVKPSVRDRLKQQSGIAERFGTSEGGGKVNGQEKTKAGKPNKLAELIAQSTPGSGVSSKSEPGKDKSKTGNSSLGKKQKPYGRNQGDKGGAGQAAKGEIDVAASIRAYQKPSQKREADKENHGQNRDRQTNRDNNKRDDRPDGKRDTRRDDGRNNKRDDRRDGKRDGRRDEKRDGRRDEKRDDRPDGKRDIRRDDKRDTRRDDRRDIRRDDKKDTRRDDRRDDRRERDERVDRRDRYDRTDRRDRREERNGGRTRSRSPVSRAESFSVKYAASTPILQIRNLERGTTADDVKTVVENVGSVAECRVKDLNNGTLAEVLFKFPQDVEKGVRTFDNTIADGREIRAQIIREYTINSGSYMTYTAPANNKSRRTGGYRQ